MSNLNEPKKETVRITPLPPPTGVPAKKAETKETVRINLPNRPPPLGSVDASKIDPALSKPDRPLRREPASGGEAEIPPPPVLARPPGATSTDSPAFRPPPSPPAIPSAAPPLPAVPTVVRPPGSLPMSATPPSLGIETASPTDVPRQETAQVAAPPARKMTRTVRMAKTQPLMAMPLSAAQAAPVKVADSSPETIIDSIPTPFCWALLGVSAVTFLIQLWTYFS
jgi:hypothetical protein